MADNKHMAIGYKPKYAVVTHYSWDASSPVWLFDTYEEAAEHLKKSFEEEVRIDTEENGYVLGENIEIDKSDDWSWATITNYRKNGDTDVTEWSVGDVRN